MTLEDGSDSLSLCNFAPLPRELLAELAQRFQVSEDEFLAALREVALLLPCLQEPFVVGEAMWI